jgi:hypothetical protein
MELKVRSTNHERRQCKQCETPFVPIVGNQVFCSNECRDAWYVRFPQRHYQIRPSKLKMCLQCGAEFVSNNRRKVYCSPECQVEHREHAYVAKQKVVRECPECHSTFETSHAGKKYCSEECRHAKKH